MDAFVDTHTWATTLQRLRPINKMILAYCNKSTSRMQPSTPASESLEARTADESSTLHKLVISGNLCI